MKKYNPHEIEKKWQEIWKKENRFSTQNNVKGKENKYILIEFPYPSGTGLHIGHILAYTAPDVHARMLRMQGKNVLFPMGCDAFGLETERTAIKQKCSPQEVVKKNIQKFRSQLDQLGYSFEWDREVVTSDSKYYKWTQWQFLKFLEKGIAYKSDALVNWCGECGVLANEEVENGKCCQCGKDTIQKTKSQWCLQMTKYADRLDADLEQTNYMQNIRASQKNWIGASCGAEVDFEIDGGGHFDIFTTCVETIFGITFMVLAPEHKLVKQLMPRIKNKEEVEEYIKISAKKSEFERRELTKEKTGCKLEGIFAINPFNNKKIPVFIGDYVLASYASGAVMGVPAHDQRDWDFAKLNNLEIIEVISGGDVSTLAFEHEQYTAQNSILVNSGQFSGQTVSVAKQKITDWLQNNGKGKLKKNYRMKDWIFARQRYFGEPIPVIHCPKCGVVAVPEKDLPVTLPVVKSYEPTNTGESPLSLVLDWVNTTCPKCGGSAKRETDTMPGWAGSSWYYLRYTDPKNLNEFANINAIKSWLPVNIYYGGNEHTNRHLLFARFWHKFLYDCGLVNTVEPFKTRISHGLVLGADGKKMSKSSGNGIDPCDVICEYGADALRLWILFIGDFQSNSIWNNEGTKVCSKFLNRIWALYDMVVDGDFYSPELEVVFNQSIKKIVEDVDNAKFNTAISQFMILINEIYKNKKINKYELKILLAMLAPFVPHIAEEMWTTCKFEPAFSSVEYPKYNSNILQKNEINLPVQINGKLKGCVLIGASASQSEAVEMAKTIASVAQKFNNQEVKKVYILGKILNIVC
ncbi:MAG: leucine--tRNA ligase [Clostridia bacterium]